MKLIIAGGRDFEDYDLLTEKVSKITSSITQPIIVISGCAKGADSLGVMYAFKHKLEIIEMPADWDKHGKSAGYLRNLEMAKIADACICFWDGNSLGTKHIIGLAKKYNLKLRVIRY